MGIVEDTIKRGQQICKDAQKAIALSEAKRKAENEKLPKHSTVLEFAEQHKPQLTPAEKGALTKAKNKARKEYEENLAREKERMEKEHDHRESRVQ